MNEIEAALFPKEDYSNSDVWAEAKEFGLCAEKQQADRYISVGRKIDLEFLLRQMNKNRDPIWALVDPTKQLGRYNGRVVVGKRRMIYQIGRADEDRQWPNTSITITTNEPWWANFYQTVDKQPTGFPVLPKRIRELVLDKSIRKDASFVAVLYKCSDWTTSKVIPADPAIIMEWKSLPKEYYALAIWGGDRAEIMEFVH